MGTARKLNELPRTVSRNVRRYFGDVTTKEMQRLFNRDASEAFGVLTRDQRPDRPQATGVRGFVDKARLLFFGLSYKLTPARRVLFALAILFAVLGFAGVNAQVSSRGVFIDFSPAWFLLSVATLVYLLALELVDRVRVRDELEVARQLQQELLPSASPSIHGYNVVHSYQTANEVGGDYYEFLVLPDGRVALFIGDASGHGMAAGLLMAIANATLKLAVDLDPAPQKVAELLNRVLWRTGDRRAFMTLFYGLLDPASGELAYVCAGHPFPLLRRFGGEIEELGEGSLPLGVRETLALPKGSATLAAGDLLLLYTDGLPEAVDARGQVFGYERIVELLRDGGSPGETHDGLVRALSTFISDDRLNDDVCLVAISRN